MPGTNEAHNMCLEMCSFVPYFTPSSHQSHPVSTIINRSSETLSNLLNVKQQLSEPEFNPTESNLRACTVDH